jgi:hypothetical protein
MTQVKLLKQHHSDEPAYLMDGKRLPLMPRPQDYVEARLYDSDKDVIYKPMGSTTEADFKTARLCYATIKSHINQPVLDTTTWEQSAAFRLEQSDAVAFYACNDHLEFVIPYEYQRISHGYTPIIWCGCPAVERSV